MTGFKKKVAGLSRTQRFNIYYWACIFFVTIGITPMLWGMLAGRYLSFIYAGLLALWVIDFGNNILRIGSISRMYGLLLIYVFALVFFSIINVYNFRSYFLSVFVALFPAVIFCQFESRIDIDDARKSASLILLLFIITFITTIKGFSENEYLVRDLVVNLHDQRFDYFSKNVGNVGHVYTAGLVFVTCASRFRSLASYCFIKKILFVITTMVSGILILMGSSGITIMASLIGLVWALLLKREKNYRFFILALAVVCFILAKDRIVDLLAVASNYVDNKYISKKLMDLALSMRGSEAVGDVAARTNRYWASFQVFLNSYCIGVGPQYAQVYSQSIVDGHSDLFAGLARYGIEWFILVVAFFRKFCRRVEDISFFFFGKRVDNEPVIICFLIMFVLQPVSMSEEIMAYMFLMLPYFDLVFDA